MLFQLLELKIYSTAGKGLLSFASNVDMGRKKAKWCKACKLLFLHPVRNMSECTDYHAEVMPSQKRLNFFPVN